MANNTEALQASCKKVSDLVRLATNEATSPEEARTTALLAVGEMRKSDLVVIPRSELERIRTVVDGAAKLAKAAQDEKRNNMVMGAIAGFAVSKLGFLGGK